MAKKTFEELLEIDDVVAQLYTTTPTLRETKFGYAYKRFYEKNVKSAVEEYNSALLDARISHALEDPNTKAVILEKSSTRGFSYSKDGLKQVINDEKRISKEFMKKEIEIEPYISTIPVDLSDGQKEILTGVLI